MGCAHRGVWYSPNKTIQETARDYQECDYEKEKYGFVPIHGSGVAAGIQQGMRHVDLMKRCMQIRGYGLINKESLESKRIEFFDAPPFP